ncbi:hypothetical protein vBBak6_118 [Bacillus phage v_B-Bak6]|uniref:Uncharacterized protein n=1 Tax=Bacillus phage v_B-Bak10 TaxID=2094736 RepID=A0A385IK03_9CAUD|nr:hypothetical protein PP654_gp031 [Bacillus phage v_B-Bak10]AXY83078.1 hypothetical protein vBBak1_118 [Bacillus phage v_B-Bak1]AXY83198.1 hypothetical protein vBBak6_118 [Bacillus phage v_B-Bak6]AXY83237.1 hypothetical protein vBBBak10_111 [Bacillus phage v_B-Bak10]
MKKLFSTIKKVALTVGLLVAGYVGGNAVTETPAAETNKNIHNGLNEVESGERNVFSQYFTITGLDDEGANVVNRYNSNDTYYISKQEFNLDFATLEIGENIVVTFDHDTTIDAVRDYSNVHQYKIYEGKDWHYDIDESLYVLGVSDRNEFDVVVLERSKYKKGEIVEVTFKDDKHDSFKNVKKVGYYNE